MNSTLPTNRYVCFALLATSGAVVDLLSKNFVFDSLGCPGDSTWTAGFFDDWLKFRFSTSINEGALWGFGQGWTSLFAGLSFLAAVGIPVWLFKYRAAQSLWLTISLSLVMSGTLGNLYDRLGLHEMVSPTGNAIYGVRDFLLFTFGTYHWPIFNFADVFLVIGAIMLGLFSLKAEATEASTAASDAGLSVARPAS